MKNLRSARIAVTAMFFLNGIFFGAWAARIPSIKQALDLSPDTLGILLLMLAFGAILSFPVAGALTDRRGARHVGLWLNYGYALAFVGLALSPNVWTLGMAIFMFGAMHGGMDIAMNAWGAQVETALRRPIMSGLHAGFSLGAGLGAGTGALAAANDIGLETHFIILAAVTVGIVAWLCHRSVDLKDEATVHQSGFFVLPRGQLILVGLLAFCSALGEGAMADWSAVYMVVVNGATEARAALGYTAFSVTMVAMRFSGGVVIRKLGEVSSARLSGASATGGALLVIFGNSYFASMTGFAFMGLGFALLMPLAFSRAANDPHQPPGAAIAGVATLGYGGMLLGPPVIGFLADNTSFPASFGLIAGLSALVIVLARVVRKTP